MQIDGFLELVKSRRTIRRFKSDPVPDECIEKILEAARWAQSGGNGQPWEFIVIKNRETIRKIADLLQEHRKRTWAIEKTRLEELRHRSSVDGPGERQGFIDAPVLIVLCGDPRTVQATVLITHFLHNEGGPAAHFLKNMANATQIMTLAAAACGLTSQWVSANYAYEAKLKALLKIPDELVVHTLVPIGYPAYKARPPYRRELKEMVHYEEYDQSKYRDGEAIFQFLLELRKRTDSAYRRLT